ncbi:MAG: TetR/AcrR family transcriptional regulator [Actinobacteria bacterium]|nr:TetR/AcrR family transcriptional regulator [Actinomycetota bacterium]
MDAAWELVHEQGLAALSLRDLAARAGITTPTVYAYFDSKNAIYDALFGRAATEFTERMNQPFDAIEPAAILVASVRRFVDFCTSDVARYQLLFQRTIPAFEPSAESYAPAVRALDAARERLALNGITEPKHLDLWTALLTGLVDQQVSNDPGGERWTNLIEEAVTMFINHCHSQLTMAKRIPKSSTPSSKGVRS